jgi:NADPH:quinone reductase-like Zn-dependent oxidoreductase
MKAVVQEGYGAPERVLKLEEIDRPPVGDDDVLIRVRATSVNAPDWITVTGVPYHLRLKSGLRRPSTHVRGTDVAGVVEAVGQERAPTSSPVMRRSDHRGPTLSPHRGRLRSSQSFRRPSSSRTVSKPDASFTLGAATVPLRSRKNRLTEGSRFRTAGNPLSSTVGVEESVQIAKSPDEVWEAIAEFAFHLRWRKGF